MDEDRIALLSPDEQAEHTRLLNGQKSTEALAKDLAIKLAVGELEKLGERHAYFGRMGEKLYNREAFEHEAKYVVSNLLIGLGCEAVVRAWEEVA